MKSILIIGAGMGGLAAGIYGQRNGFQTMIFEKHLIPGGQCTSWRRGDYIFDPTLHNFNGFKPDTKINAFWTRLGALPCEKVRRNEFVSAVFPDGTCFHNFFDLEKLHTHLIDLSPEDGPVIDEYIQGLKSFVTENDWFGINYFGSPLEKLSLLPFFLGRLKYFRYTLGTFAERFKNPRLRQAFSLIRNSIPEIPLFAYCVEHANYIIGDSGWPRGGGITLAWNMAAEYQKLGGIIHFQKEVVKILTEDHSACGVELKDGMQIQTDYVISNADGRKTILEMLNGKFVNGRISEYCQPNAANRDVPMSTQVFLGVKRDLSAQPSALILFLPRPETIGGHVCDHLDLQIYGFDSSMAAAGKGVIKIELIMKPSHFPDKQQDKAGYEAEKNRIADQVITILENYFPDLRDDIEEIDVVTIQTWERYIGGSQGFNNFPNKHRELTDIRNVVEMIFGIGRINTLPRLKNFYLAGQWVTSMGSLFANAASGRDAVKKICKESGVKFAD
jgi:phytoene dehydrogenase-like protein